MLLSESEAFWFAILNDELESRGAFVEPSRIVPRLTPSQPLDLHSIGEGPTPGGEQQVEAKEANLEPIEAETNPPVELPDSGGWVYQAILEHATNYGVARKAELRLGTDSPIENLPADVVWATVQGQLLSKEQVDDVCREVSGHVAEARQRASALSGSAAVLQAFEQGLDSILAIALCGYSSSTPRYLYGLSESGAKRVMRQVVPRDRGIFLSLLQLVCSSVPLPAIERLAMAAAGYRADKALQAWVPSLSTLHKSVGVFSPSMVGATFKEFESSNTVSDGWQLGTLMNQLLRSATKYSDEAYDAADSVYSHYDDDISLDTVEAAEDISEEDGDATSYDYSGDEPAEFDEGDAAEQQNGNRDQPNPKSAEIASTTPSSVTPFLLELWLAKVTAFNQRESATHEPVDEELRDYAADHIDEALGDFFAEAEDVANRCRECRLQGVAEMIKAAIDAVPQINPLHSGTTSDISSAYRELSQAFTKSRQLISDAMKVAYGELRLRELKWDEHGLPPPALSGWTRQNENIRAAIQVAIEQLNNGLPPYVVLTQLAPASEALVRQLAARHLDEFQGLNPGKLLHNLRQTIGLNPDDHDVRAALSAAQALVSLRNWVVHESEADWGRDHAAFFLNGLSILLRHL